MRKFLNSLILFSVIAIPAFSQVASSDLALLGQDHFIKHEYDKRKIHFMASHSSSAIVKYNPVTLVFGSLMYFYQSALSPQISAQCRFQLSCSNFSKEAIHDFGLVKGLALSADRIMKCNRIAVGDARPGEYDEKFKLFDTPEKYRTKH